MKSKLFLFALMLALPNLVFAAAKKTVCAITINSDNEVKTFAKNLPQDQFNPVIELTAVDEKQGVNKYNWFDKACDSGVQCDILIVSGHFGGAFFGNKGISLSTEDLEQRVCRNACGGILNRPKEVWLFGCNTLARKDKDRRTPEEYYQVLRADNIPEGIAQMVVALRYSPIGASFEDRMRQIFRSVPKIYGFHSIAPAGKNIEDMLSGYLAVTAKNYSSRLDGLTNNSQNAPLSQALKSTNFAQTSGLAMDKGMPDRCLLRDDKLKRIDKLKWIQDRLDSPNLFDDISFISSFIQESSEKNKWSAEEDNVLSQIRNYNGTNRKKIDDLLIASRPEILRPQVMLARFAHTVNWYTDAEYFKKLKQVVLPRFFAGDFSRDYVDLMCSSKLEVEIPLSEIPQGHFEQSSFYQVLTCLGPQSEELIAKIVDKFIAVEVKKNAEDILKPSMGGIADSIGHYLKLVSIRDFETFKKLYSFVTEPEKYGGRYSGGFNFNFSTNLEIMPSMPSAQIAQFLIQEFDREETALRTKESGRDRKFEFILRMLGKVGRISTEAQKRIVHYVDLKTYAENSIDVNEYWGAAAKAFMEAQISDPSSLEVLLESTLEERIYDIYKTANGGTILYLMAKAQNLPTFKPFVQKLFASKSSGVRGDAFKIAKGLNWTDPVTLGEMAGSVRKMLHDRYLGEELMYLIANGNRDPDFVKRGRELEGYWGNQIRDILGSVER